jgi:hypothetical protein
MSDFVQQCRREWERLGVPDPVANEMAADLAADLAEAEADGVSAEEVLGKGFFDPRSFATSWAAERGVIPAAPDEKSAARRPLMLVALATFTVIGLVGAAWIALRVHTQVAVARPTHLPFGPPGSVQREVVAHGAPFGAQALPWIMLLAVAILAAAVAAWLWSRWTRSHPPQRLT